MSTAGPSATWVTTARSTPRSPSAARSSSDGRIHVHSGAGIVAGSVPEREFEETEQKSAAIRRAIQMAGAGAQAQEPIAEPSDEPSDEPLVAGRSR